MCVRPPPQWHWYRDLRYGRAVPKVLLTPTKNTEHRRLRLPLSQKYREARRYALRGSLKALCKAQVTLGGGMTRSGLAASNARWWKRSSSAATATQAPFNTREMAIDEVRLRADPHLLKISAVGAASRARRTKAAAGRTCTCSVGGQMSVRTERTRSQQQTLTVDVYGPWSVCHICDGHFINRNPLIQRSCKLH